MTDRTGAPGATRAARIAAGLERSPSEASKNPTSEKNPIYERTFGRRSNADLNVIGW